MRMSRRAGLISGLSLPTFAELFATCYDFYQSGRSSGSASNTLSLSPGAFYAGETWYLFFCAGPSMEISRIDMSGSAMTNKTRLRLAVPSGSTAYGSKLNAAGTSIVSEDGIYSGTMSLLWFKNVLPDTVDYMFLNASINTLQSYYDASLTNANSTLRVTKSTITAKDGVCLASFHNVPSGGTSAPVCGITSTKTPGTQIKCAYGANDEYGNGFVARSPLREVVTSGVSYMVPTADGSTTARVRGYTLKSITENW